MRSRLVSSLVGVALAVAVAGAAQPDAAAVPPSRAAELPAPGSWAIGWSAVVVRTEGGHVLRALDSSGASRDVAAVPTGTEVVDVRHDARRIITKSAHGEEDPVIFRIWDVGTGKSWQVSLQKSSNLYFGPGDQLLSEYYYPEPRTMLRTAAGSPIRALSLPGDWRGAVSPGGTAIYTEGGNGMEVFSVAANKVIRTIPNHAPHVSCIPRGLWSGGQMRFGCYDIPGNSAFYKANTSTGEVTRLVPNVGDAGFGFATEPATGMGFWNWSCGDGYGEVAVDHGDRAEPVRPKGPWGDGKTANRAIAGAGTSLWLTVRWSCDSTDERTSLVRYDTQTKSTTVLAGPAEGTAAGSVRSVQTIDGLT